MKSHIALSCPILLLAATAPAGPTFDIDWHSIDGGGGVCAGGTFTLHGVIGQHDAGGPMTGGSFALSGGFLAGGPLPCPGDTDGDSTVGINDFLALLADWGRCPGCPSDIDGDGAVGINDFLALLAGWGPCP